MARTYDIVILGATPAGWSAAYALARNGRKVAVVDCPASPSESPLADWLPKDLLTHAGMPRSLVSHSKATPFSGVQYHNQDLANTADYNTRGTLGHLVETDKLTAAIKAAATKEGARTRNAKTPPRVHLEEQGVSMAGDVQLRASLMIVVHSRPFEVLGDLSLPLRTVPTTNCTAAGLDVPVNGSALARSLGKKLHVLETPERSELGLLFLTGKTLHIRVVSRSAAFGNRADELSQLVAACQGNGLLGDDLPLNKARGAVWSPPAGLALELESHAAKRCLLAATAGGFADTISGHTLYPGIVSALLAAELAHEVLGNSAPQERLMEFRNRWREQLGDYLRPPGTSLQLLLPLLFANKRLVKRFSEALLYGKEI